MKYYKVGQPPNAVIHERATTDHVVGLFGVGLKSYPELFKDPKEWAKYKSKPEIQWGGGAGETSTCTNQALCEIYERFINYYYQNHLFALETVKFLEDEGYIIDGICNLSESALAVWSGTDKNRGNSLKKNCDVARKVGLIPESRHKDDYTTETTYWRTPNKEMEDLGKKFIKHIGMDHAWLFSGLTKYNKGYYDYMAKQLTHSLIYCAVPISRNWNNAVVRYDGRKDAGHAVVAVKHTGDTNISDSYIPQDKTLTNEYLINYGMKVVVYPLKEKEELDLDGIIENFLDNPPLQVTNNTVHFGEFFRRTYHRDLTQEELQRYVELREPYLRITPVIKNKWYKSLTRIIKQLFE